ncbi:MAG: DUF3806 domain-containing protein [Lentisphaerales bacterium]|nr:DUF3806 domain-containing protein [Lentisphaerales bacterium]
MKFHRLKDQDYKTLAHLFISTKELISLNLNYEISETPADLQAFQNVIDLKIIDNESGAHFYQGMGVMLGRMIISNRKGFDWWVMEDKLGKDIVLRYKETDLFINITNHIAAKVSDGKPINIRFDFEGLIRDIDQFFIPTMNKA